MKKIVISLLVVVGLAGLIELINYRPNSTAASTNQVAVNSNAYSSPNTASPTPASSTTSYKDGTYTGSAFDNPYGTVQIATIIKGGKITSVSFIQMPSDQRHSQEVTAAAEPYLLSETVQSQSSNIDIVSGATSTSEAYIQSLQSSLNQAKA